MNESLYLGHVELDGTLTIPLQVRTDGRAPVAADSTPAFRVYGPDPTAIMSSGSGSFSGPVDSQTGFYKATLACTSANGYASGQNYTIRCTFAVSSVNKVIMHTFSVT